MSIIIKCLLLPFRIKTDHKLPIIVIWNISHFPGFFTFVPFLFSRSQGHPSNKRRPDGDGMDSSVEDAGLEVPERHLTGDCQCACDHVVYSPTAYTCLQVSEIYWGLALKQDNPYFVLEPAILIDQILDETNKIVGRGMMKIYRRFGLDKAIYGLVWCIEWIKLSNLRNTQEILKLNIWKVTVIQKTRLNKSNINNISDRPRLRVF